MTIKPFNTLFFPLFSSIVSAKTDLNVQESLDALANLTVSRVKMLQTIRDPQRARRKLVPAPTPTSAPISHSTQAGDNYKEPKLLPQDTACEVTCKIVFIGGNSAGRTSFIHYFINRTKLQDPDKTIGAAFSTAKIMSREKSVNIAIWDTTGQERYRSLIPMYMRGAEGIVLMYSITDKDSYNEIARRYERIKTEYPSAVLMVIGNKSDAGNGRKVTVDEGERLTNDIHASMFFESNK